MLTYLALRLLSITVPLLPPRLGHALFGFIGDFAYCVGWRSRQNVSANLLRVLGSRASQRQRRAAIRDVFRTAALNYYDLFRVPRLNAAKLETLLRVYGWEHVDSARRHGKGVLIVAPHLGNLDIVGQVAVLRDVPCTIPTEHLRSDRLRQLVTATRASLGLRIVPVDGTAGPLRVLYQALRRNELVGIVGDRDLQGHGLIVPFFDEPVRFPNGSVTLALRTGAPLLPGRAMRLADGSYRVDITPPLDFPRTGDLKRDVQLGTEMVAKALERFIRDTPGQWVVFQPVWKEQRSVTNCRAPLGIGGDL